MKKNTTVILSISAAAVAGIAYLLKGLPLRDAEDEDDHYDNVPGTEVENFRFLGYNIDTDEAAEVANMFEKLGVIEEVDVVQCEFRDDGEDKIRDLIISNGVGIDTTRPYYSVSPDYRYIVWYNTEGTIHGLCFASEDFKLVELR